jgi:ribosomal subunit interface protein
MTIHITSRHFKAHETIHSYAEQAVTDLSKYYDGIIKADVILSFEKSRKSVKLAEVNVGVYGAMLSGRARSEDFLKSIDQACAKVLSQLIKYKDKLHAKNRTIVRTVREKA